MLYCGCLIYTALLVVQEKKPPIDHTFIISSSYFMQLSHLIVSIGDNELIMLHKLFDICLMSLIGIGLKKPVGVAGGFQINTMTND